MREIDQIIVHCSATKATMDIGADTIRTWHVEENKWSDIGYHLVIRRNGAVELGRPIEVAGAHAYGHNKTTIGVCLIGGVMEDGKTPDANFTKAQMITLEGLNKLLVALFDIKKDTVGHRDLGDVGKSCPCFDVRAFLNVK